MIRLEELDELPVLYIPDATDEHGKSLRQYLQGWNLVFRDEVEFDSLEVASAFLREDYGVGILPSYVARTHGDALRRTRIEGMPTARFGTHRVFLTYREDLDISGRLLRSLLHAAREAVQRLKGVPTSGVTRAPRAHTE